MLATYLINKMIKASKVSKIEAVLRNQEELEAAIRLVDKIDVEKFNANKDKVNETLKKVQ
jgi:hypothetical protein